MHWYTSRYMTVQYMHCVESSRSPAALAMLQSPIPLPASLDLVRDPINKLICHYSREAGIEICSYFIDLVIVVSCKLYWYGMLWFTCEIEQVSRSCMLSLCVVNLHCSVDLCQFRVKTMRAICGSGIRSIRTIRMPTGSDVRMAKLAFVPGLHSTNIILSNDIIFHCH